MRKMLKDIFGFVSLFWLCFIWTWKLVVAAGFSLAYAVAILCLWACSCIVALLWLITESVLNNGGER